MDSDPFVREEGRRTAPALASQCTRCGHGAAVIDDDTPLCGTCFLDAALRRRRRLSRAPRGRRRFTAS